MKFIKIIVAVLLTGLCMNQAWSQQSVLASGNWYKLKIKKNGVYKINYDLLKKMGIDPGKIDPRKIKIFGNGGGMLPQANAAARPVDLIENSIFVKGEDDGQFNKEDFILFYAQGPDRSYFDATRDIFFYEKNLYDDHNFYFLTVTDEVGKRVTTRQNLNLALSPITVFDDFMHHEIDAYNELQSGREWFGENFQIEPTQTFKLEISGIVENSTIKLVSDVLARSKNNSSFKIFFNNAAVGEQFIPYTTETQYGIKGRHQRDSLSFNSDVVSAANQSAQEVTYQFLETAGGKGYLDYFLLSYKRKLALYGQQTIFRSGISLQNAASAFEISNLSSSSILWDITNPLSPQIQSFLRTNDKGVFSINTTSLHEFIAFNNDVPAPDGYEKIVNQNLHALATPNLIIVAHENFIDAAARLAAHRQNHDGWTTAVVSTAEVFNEFSSGRQDVSAIRDFVKSLYDKNAGQLKALLLFGRGSYDYKDRVYDNTNLVPVYESRNSLHPLETYSSDDYFAFLENNEGTWNEAPAEDHTLDIGVGRFPVKTATEADDVVNKIINYDTNIKLFGRWRKEIVFVADDGDANVHQSQSDQLAKQVENANPEFNTRRIFLDAYQQIVKPSGEISPDANKAVEDALDRGALIINYTGHGGEKVWAQEKIFDNLVIDELDNKNYPLFVTATCEFGRNDDPGIISSAELGFLKKNGGAIGMVTTARPVSSNTNFELNQAFYNALFLQEADAYLALGEVVRRTKNNSTSGVSNRNFSLLGDPSMTLALPRYSIVVTEIKNEEGNDSLKALSTVHIKGEVFNTAGNKASTFNGTLDATLFDKETPFTTLGNENAPYSYKQWTNALFRGKASVVNGDFEFGFIVPKNIAYQVGSGKLSLYADNVNKTVDATGVTMDFKVGKSDDHPGTDNTPPDIQLFMGDTTFIDGGTVSSDTYLVAKLHDASGINISAYGIGNNLMAILDQQETFVVDDYYEAEKNDYTHGRIVFRMKGLAPGKHNLVLKAWDTYNNPGEAVVPFIVSDGDGIRIQTFQNFPNPFTDKTTVYFTHNRPGDDLDVSLSLYNIQGEVLKNFDFSISSSNYRVELIELDETAFGKKLSPGLYLARLFVRSLTNGSKNEQVTKLIILN